MGIESVARRKLRQLEIAGRLDDLRVPPGNRLEALKGDRAGQHSIRMNDQYRVCFRWTPAGPEDVEIVDYHWRRRWAKLKPVTPGELLLEEFLKPMGITKYRLAKEIGVPAQRIGEIVAGKRAITADTDLRLCRFFGLSNGYWLRAQAAYDTEVAQEAWPALEKHHSVVRLGCLKVGGLSDQPPRPTHSGRLRAPAASIAAAASLRRFSPRTPRRPCPSGGPSRSRPTRWPCRSCSR